MPRISSYDPDAPTPAVGSKWLWEPTKPWAYEPIEVVEVKWNGEEWWVRTEARGGMYWWFRPIVTGSICWNDLSRFWEAVEPDTSRARAKADERLLEAVIPEFARKGLEL